MGVPVQRGWKRITDALYGLFVRNISSTERKVYDSEGNIFAESLQTDVNYVPTGSEPVGTIYYDSANNTYSAVLPNGVIGQFFQEQHIYGKNTSGAKILNGQCISLTSVGGQFSTFGLTDATDTTSSLSFIGMATQDIEINAFGYVTVRGIVRDVDTDGLTEGASLYIDEATPGAYTESQPSANNYTILVGKVDYANQNHGRILVTPMTYPKLEDLSGVDGGILDTTGQVMIWDQENGNFDFNQKVMLTPDGGLAVKMTNRTGNVTVKGEVVHPDSSNNNSVVKIVVDEPDPIGVFLHSGVANGAEAWVVVSGIADVYFVGNTTAGHIARGFLTADGASYVTGQALSEAVPTSPFATDKHFYELGHVLESRTGAGLAKCVLHFN